MTSPEVRASRSRLVRDVTGELAKSKRYARVRLDPRYLEMRSLPYIEPIYPPEGSHLTEVAAAQKLNF